MVGSNTPGMPSHDPPGYAPSGPMVAKPTACGSTRASAITFSSLSLVEHRTDLHHPIARHVRRNCLWGAAQHVDDEFVSINCVRSGIDGIGSGGSIEIEPADISARHR